MKPYRQGDLDGLCGAYAVINAMRLISKNTNAEEWQDTFLKTMKFQLKHRHSISFIVYGLSQVKVARIMQRIIRPSFDFTYSRPFKNRKKIALTELWDSFSGYLYGHDKRCIIIGYETETYDHWTIVRSMTVNRLNLFDSGGRKVLNRRRCSTTELSPETPILIDFTATFYLEGK